MKISVKKDIGLGVKDSQPISVSICVSKQEESVKKPKITIPIIQLVVVEASSFVVARHKVRLGHTKQTFVIVRVKAGEVLPVGRNIVACRLYIGGSQRRLFWDHEPTRCLFRAQNSLAEQIFVEHALSVARSTSIVNEVQVGWQLLDVRCSMFKSGHRPLIVHRVSDIA